MSPTKTLKFPVFCSAHPAADLHVVGVEPPEPQSTFTRVHLTCDDCGLPWTYTLSRVPTKDHVVERLGVDRRHPTMSVPVVV